MTPDRERIEREACDLVEHWVSATPLRVSMTDQTYLSSAIMSLVLRERAAALEDAANKIQAAGGINEIPHSELVRALAAQERAT